MCCRFFSPIRSSAEDVGMSGMIGSISLLYSIEIVLALLIAV